MSLRSIFVEYSESEKYSSYDHVSYDDAEDLRTNEKENLYVGNEPKHTSKEEEEARGAVTEVIDLESSSSLLVANFFCWFPTFLASSFVLLSL